MSAPRLPLQCLACRFSGGDWLVTTAGASDRHPGDHDRRMWPLAQRGDAKAFASIYELHADHVYRYCLRRCADWSTAEDLTAGVFLELWRRRHDVNLDEEAGLRPWLFGVAANVARNHHRGQRRLERFIASCRPVMDTPDHADEVASRVDDAQTIEAVHQALGGLSENDRDILRLCLWEDLSPTQAAISLHIGSGTARTRLSRARARLLDALAGRASTAEERP